MAQTPQLLGDLCKVKKILRSPSTLKPYLECSSHIKRWVDTPALDVGDFINIPICRGRVQLGFESLSSSDSEGASKSSRYMLHPQRDVMASDGRHSHEENIPRMVAPKGCSPRAAAAAAFLAQRGGVHGACVVVSEDDPDWSRSPMFSCQLSLSGA